MRPSHIFFWRRGGGVFCFCAAKEEGKGAACGTGAEPPRPQGLPLPPRRGPCDLFPPPPRQEKMSCTAEAKPTGPPACGGVRGGVGCAPGGEVFCASAWSWLSMLCLLSDRARCDDRRKESPRPEEAKPTEPPARGGKGGT